MHNYECAYDFKMFKTAAQRHGCSVSANSLGISQSCSADSCDQTLRSTRSAPPATNSNESAIHQCAPTEHKMAHPHSQIAALCHPEGLRPQAVLRVSHWSRHRGSPCCPPTSTDRDFLWRQYGQRWSPAQPDIAATQRWLRLRSVS